MRIALLILAALAIPPGADARTVISNVGTATRLVLGNYTPDTGAYGTTVAAYQQDMVDSQAMGIDGWELDMQAWGSEASYFNYQQAFANIFQAAHNLNNGFKLYFFIDCQQYGNPTCSSSAAEAMKKYSTDRNYLHYNGKPVMGAFSDSYISTSGSADETFWSAVYSAVTRAGITPFYIPSFYDGQLLTIPPNLSTYTTAATGWYVNTLAADTDGLAIWSIDVPEVNLTNQKAIAAVMAAKNKVLMPSIVPFFSQLRLLFRPGSGAVGNMEQNGAEGLISSWMWIIQTLQPPFVHIQTWNDHTESYGDLASTAELRANDIAAWTMPAAALWTHAAYAEVNKYFTQWYKTGAQPTGWPDSMYVFYRNGSQRLVPSAPPSGTSVNWEPDGIHPTLDDIYVTTILRLPATVTVHSGTTTTSFSAPAGVSSARVPFATGAQSFNLVRGSSTLVSITGANINTSETQYYNVNPLAYYGYSR